MNNVVRGATSQWINFLIHDEGIYKFDGTIIHFCLTKRVVHPHFAVAAWRRQLGGGSLVAAALSATAVAAWRWRQRGGSAQ
jgi:hypothetical protein